jgi:hypothetical protein
VPGGVSGWSSRALREPRPLVTHFWDAYGPPQPMDGDDPPPLAWDCASVDGVDHRPSHRVPEECMAALRQEAEDAEREADYAREDLYDAEERAEEARALVEEVAERARGPLPYRQPPGQQQASL